MKIKAITLWQPWASLVISGAKHYETRSWNTNHRGLLAIHAAKARVSTEIFYSEPFSTLLKAAGIRTPNNMPLGSILGFVTLRHTCHTEQIRETLVPTQIHLGDYSNDRYAWHLSYPIHFPNPIPISGRQGLWTWTIPADLQYLIKQTSRSAT